MMADVPTSTLSETGFDIVLGVFSDDEIDAIVEGLTDAAGPGSRRMLDRPEIRELAAAVRERLGLGGVAIQCSLFAKRPEANWFVPPHQDLSTPVRRIDGQASSMKLTEKEGETFCQPPAETLAGLTACRLQLDDQTADDGPLEVYAGSHRRGRLDPEALGVVTEGEPAVLAAPRGSVVLMKPLAVHASARSRSGRPRRVLHFVFADVPPPAGLAWRWEV